MSANDGSKEVEALLHRALKSVAAGQLSVESVLRSAAGASARFRAWLDTALAQAQQREPRRIQIWDEPRYPAQLLERVLERARHRLGRKRAVQGLFWGVKYSRGRAQPGIALVVQIRLKRRRGTVPRGQWLPRTFRVSVDGKRYSFPIDVQQPQPGRRQSAGTIRVGDGARVEVGQAVGTLGAVLPDRNSAIIAGHVARAGGSVAGAIGRRARVRASSGESFPIGKVVECVDDRWVDAARVDGVPDEAMPVLGNAPTTLRDLQLDETSVLISLLLAREDRPVETWVDGIGVGDWFGTTRMEGLIRLNRLVTIDGDSGAPAVDSNGRLVGFVVGFASGRTYLLPARRAIDEVT